jgi:hypothetical protein
MEGGRGEGRGGKGRGEGRGGKGEGREGKRWGGARGEEGEEGVLCFSLGLLQINVNTVIL